MSGKQDGLIALVVRQSRELDLDPGVLDGVQQELDRHTLSMHRAKRTRSSESPLPGALKEI